MADQVKTTEFFYEPAESSAKGGRFLNILQVLAIVLVIFVVLYLVILLPNQVDGQSMEPNFYDQELLFTDKIINIMGTTEIGKSLGYSYGRGDVVIFPFGETSLIKRIIAVEGDQLRIQDDSIYLNGVQLKEDYIPEGVPTQLPYGFSTMQEGETVTIPSGSFFLMGDNRTNSKDSRFSDVGFIERTQLSGRVFLRYWPLGRFSSIGRGTTNLSQTQ
ncbi:MAG: signal peptidase I [Candidatus Dojkabacteria bacterium]